MQKLEKRTLLLLYCYQNYQKMRHNQIIKIVLLPNLIYVAAHKSQQPLTKYHKAPTNLTK